MSQGQSPGDLQPGLSPALAVRPRLIFRTSEFSSLRRKDKKYLSSFSTLLTKKGQIADEATTAVSHVIQAKIGLTFTFSADQSKYEQPGRECVRPPGC